MAPGLSFQVHFLAVQSTGEIRLTMTEGADLIVEARGAGASFTSNADQLVIDNRSSAGDFEIAIPKAAPRIEIRVGSRRVFLKDHSVIVPALPDSGPSRIALAQLGGTSP